VSVYYETPDSGRIARATHRLQIGWGSYNAGLISFDHSTFGGTDVFGISPLDSTFGGTYDDVSSRLATGRFSRGRDNNLDVMLAGEATIDLRDPLGIFNPNNVTGPLYGQLEDRLHPVKWEATTASGRRGLFAGWTRRFRWEPGGRKGITRVECVDAFYWLERAKPLISSTGVTTTGAAIGLILDAVELSDPSMRALDTGDTIPDFEADGSKTGLELIQDLLQAERGVFYISGDGLATYRSRLSRLTAPSTATFDHRVTAIEPGVDFDAAKTRVTVTRVDAAGTATYTGTATSSGASYQKLGYSDLPEIRTPYLISDAQADELASWILAQVQTPTPPMYGFKIDGRDSDLLEQILDRDLVDRITANTPRGNTQGEYHIDRLTINVDAKGLMASDWLLSRATTAAPIVFDTAAFDEGYVFVY
jgi:hypothetical protein